MKHKKPKSVAEYIKAEPRSVQAKLREMRRLVRAAAPGAKEDIKWGMPALVQRRMLVAYAAFKHHIGFFPTSSPIRAFAKDLKNYRHAKGSIQFPYEKPLPKALIRKITRLRVKEVRDADAKWKS